MYEIHIENPLDSISGTECRIEKHNALLSRNWRSGKCPSEYKINSWVKQHHHEGGFPLSSPAGTWAHYIHVTRVRGGFGILRLFIVSHI